MTNPAPYLDPDQCAARRCRAEHEGTYYGIPLCDSHWALICRLRPKVGAVRAIRDLLPRQARGLVLEPLIHLPAQVEETS